MKIKKIFSLDLNSIMITLPNQLELLEFTAKQFSRDTLKDTYLIGCQHVLPSLYYLLKAAIQLGLPPENISIIGKCYSSSKLAFNMLCKEKIFVSDDSFSYDSHLSFDEQFKDYIEKFIQESLLRMKCLDNKKIILLDDGGELITAAKKHINNYNITLGVEQTSSGYNKLCNQVFNFPIINVARSYAKLNFESPHIAISILNHTRKIINCEKKQILIIGKGAIGIALEKYLEKQAYVSFHDIQSNNTLINDVNLNQYDIIIGATGNNVMNKEMYHHLKKNVYLISASSSDREFDAVNLRKIVDRNSECHKSYNIQNINLINSGFPLNFYGSDYDNVPLNDIQLTFSLLLAGICQRNSLYNGISELDKDIQYSILKKYFSLNSTAENIYEI